MYQPAVLKLLDGTLAITNIPGGDRHHEIKRIHEIRRMLEQHAPKLTQTEDGDSSVYCITRERRYVHRGYVPLYEEQP